MIILKMKMLMSENEIFYGYEKYKYWCLMSENFMVDIGII